MFDAVHVVVGAVRELNRSQEIGVKPLSCTSPQIWQHGTSLMNYLRMVSARTGTPPHPSTRAPSPRPSVERMECIRVTRPDRVHSEKNGTLF